jgi:hypothetical protein
MVETMINLGTVVPLDHSKLPSIKNIAPKFPRGMGSSLAQKKIAELVRLSNPA